MSCDKIYLRKDQITCDEEAGVSLKDLIVQVIKENPNFFASLIFQSISTGGGGGSISTPMALDDLTDVVSPNSASGDLLYRTPQEWINTPGVFELLKYKASTVARESNPNITMGSVGSNYVFEGRTLQELIEDMFFTYQAPAFTSFTYASTPRYIGESVMGTFNFNWTYTNPNNVSGLFTITDVTNSNTVLYNNLTPTDLIKQHTQTNITKYAIQSHTWKIEGTNTQNSNFSRNYTINWGVKILSCVGDSETFDVSYLVNTGISGYTSANLLSTSRASSVTTTREIQIGIDAGDQGLLNGTYKYILIPISSTYNAQTYTLLSDANILFYDISLAPPFNSYQMEDAGSLTINNEHGVSITYSVKRSINPSFSDFTIEID